MTVMKSAYPLGISHPSPDFCRSWFGRTATGVSVVLETGITLYGKTGKNSVQRKLR